MSTHAPHVLSDTSDLSMKPSSHYEIDDALARLERRKARWASLPAADLVSLLDEVRQDFSTVNEEWAQRSATAKGMGDKKDSVGEEWLFVGVIARTLRLLQQSLNDIAQGERPQLPAPFYVNDRGHVVAPVFPASSLDKYSLQGISGEVWMRAGDSVEADAPGPGARVQR